MRIFLYMLFDVFPYILDGHPLFFVNSPIDYVWNAPFEINFRYKESFSLVRLTLYRLEKPACNLYNNGYHLTLKPYRYIASNDAFGLRF